MANMKNAAQATPAVVSNVPTPEVKKPEIKKIARSTAEALVASGDITKEMLEKWIAAGRVTSGDGGGEDIFTQLAAGGVSEALIAKTKLVLAEVNAVLWKDAKTYIGKSPNHKFSFTDKETKKDYTYEAPAEIEFAAWVKHFDPKQKDNRAAAIAKK